MNEEQNSLAMQGTASKPFRPALIGSEHIANEYSSFLHHLLTGLADESVPAALVYPPGYDVDSVISSSTEVIIYPVIGLPIMVFQNVRFLIEKLQKFKPTVLHCLCESKALLTRYLARRLSLPYILTSNSFQKRFSRFRISSKDCKKIIVPAKSIAENIATVYPEFAERIEPINIGTFVEEENVCFSKPDELTSIVTIHPMNNAEEFENLLGAVRHLLIDGYEFMLVIISGGQPERRLRKSLAGLGLSQVVVNIPRLEPSRSVLAAGDIFVQPVVNTAFAPLTLEAMSIGVVVASCRGGVDDLIIEEQTGVIFDASDELSIYSCLQKLFDKRDWARKLARGAQEHLRENYTVSNMVSSILRIYRQAQE